MSVQTTYTTAPAAAYAGMLADDTENDAITMVNADSVSIPFGSPVAYKGSPASDKDAALPATTGDKLAGIVIHSHDFARTFQLPDGTTVGELDGTGVKVGAEIAVLKKGTIWVVAFDAVKPGDPLYVAVDNGGAHYTAQAQMGNTADSGHAIAVTNAEWRSSCAAGKFAKLNLGAKFA